MAGNVWEWISDSVSSGGTWATGYIRGGSWFETDVALAAYMLDPVANNFYGSDYGVRCAKDAPVIMSEPKRPLKVFLCHAHADRDAVRALYTRLTNDGVDAWLDKEKLLPGQDWELKYKMQYAKPMLLLFAFQNNSIKKDLGKRRYEVGA
ncbi:MAG: TIR domain-containing protein [Anaerolineales bacterium]|nr:TIR domain-containing protein [Anaerolineales bacterium]